MSSLSATNRSDTDGAVASCSTTRTTTVPSGPPSTQRSYTSPSRRSPTTSVRSAQASIGARNNSVSTNRCNVEEDPGTIKSGLITGFMSLTKSSKKTFFAVLSDRCLALFENHKAIAKKKAPRHVFDLATCFNINRHDDAKLKTTVSIMTPDDTFIFRAADEEKQMRDVNDRNTLDWYEAMIGALVIARALFLGRPVLQAEFFEYCWDVILVPKPKIRKPIPNPDKFENICLKKPELAKRHRLGFYAHTIVLCRMGIQPSYTATPQSGVPPFQPEHCIEIQRHNVASFGFQEKYFIMRIGRAATLGMCEIWAQCESEEVAASIHSRLNEIIEREGKKRKSQPSSAILHAFHQSLTPSSSSSTTGGASTTASSSAATSTKDLSSTQSESTHSPKVEHLTPEPPSHCHYTLPPKTSSMSSSSSTSSYQRQYFNKKPSLDEDPSAALGQYRPLGAKSIDQSILQDIKRQESNDLQQPRSLTMGSQSPASTSWLKMLKRNVGGTTTSSSRTPSTIKRDDIISITTTQPRKPAQHFYPVIDWSKQRASLVSGGSQPDDETEDSGGTLKHVDYDDPIPPKSHVYMNGMYPHECLIEHSMDITYDYDEWGSRGNLHNEDTSQQRRRQTTDERDSGKGDDGEYNRLTPDGDSASIPSVDHDSCEAFSTSSSLDASQGHEKGSNSSGSVSHLLVPSTTKEQHLEDIQSYISDSSDSCYSSLNANSYLQNPPRAFSFSNNLLQSGRNNDTAYEMMQPGGKLKPEEPPKPFGTEESLPLSNEGLQLGEEASTISPMPKSVRIPGNMLLQPKEQQKEDLRKRAFSLGSRTFALPFGRKLSHNKPSSSKASSIADESENECNESVASHRSHPEHSRSDSIDSSISHPGRSLKAIKNSRKTSDLVEVDFPSPPGTIISQYNAIGSKKNGSSGSVDSTRPRLPSFLSKVSVDRNADDSHGYHGHNPDPTMNEARCFMSREDEIMYAIIKEKDTTSLYSTKTESSMPYFETIEENVSSPPSPRSSSRHSRKSLEPKSPTEPLGSLKNRRKESSSSRLQPRPVVPEVDYVVITSEPVTRKTSVPSPRLLKDPPTRKSLTQSKSDNLNNPAASTTE